MSDKKQIEVTIKPFDRTLVKNTSFRCGQPDLDEWLRRYAGQQERSHNTRTFLAVPAESSQIVGYYATTGYRLEPDEASVSLGVARHAYPVPAVLLARLAVDLDWAGCGIGKQLLIHALDGIAEANRKVGFEVLVIDAIDDAAVTFYARFGFTRFESHPRKLFLPMKNLLATLAASASV